MRDGIEVEAMKIRLNTKAYDEMKQALSGGSWLRQFTLMVATRMHELISKYPPATAANRPKRGETHYERGLGSVYTRVGGGRSVRKTSEMLGRRWDILPGASGTTRLRNNASYAGYVHDARYQAWFHGDRGWRTDEEVIRQMADAGEFEDFAEIVIMKDVL
jgi:hypothetical protein